jgi:multidrug resistance efflux pump
MVTGAAHVEQGQVLLRLDSNQERAKEEMARSAVYLAIAEEARLQAEAEGGHQITFPSELLQKTSDASAQRAMGDQKRRFEERRAARKIEISILEERIAQSQRQIQGNTAQSKGAPDRARGARDFERRPRKQSRRRTDLAWLRSYQPDAIELCWEFELANTRHQ